MRPALFIAAVVLTVAPMGVAQKQSASSHRTSVEEVIKKLDDERIQAQIHADATALDHIYAADFIGVGPSGRVRTKPQVISDFTSGDLKFQSITTDDVQVRVYGNTAVETGRSTMMWRACGGGRSCRVRPWVLRVFFGETVRVVCVWRVVGRGEGAGGIGYFHVTSIVRSRRFVFRSEWRCNRQSLGFGL